MIGREGDFRVCGEKVMTLSEVQVSELASLVGAELERQLEAIHSYLQFRYTMIGGYKEAECWGELKAKLLSLIGSQLALLSLKFRIEPVKPAVPGAGSGS